VTLTGVEQLEFEEAGLRRLGRGRRTGVVVLGAILATFICGVIGVAFVQSSSWYSYGTDRALDRESRARVERIRDAVKASGAAPEAVTRLDAALDPNADPTAVRICLVAAHEVLGAADDSELVQAAGKLQEIIQTMRPGPIGRETATLRPVPALEWPWR
jgi:hypothetical protein